jgi:hypothetical protein
MMKKVSLNSALLEKLKSELISLKMKFAENQMILADVSPPKFTNSNLKASNQSSRLKKEVEKSEVNFGLIIPNLIYMIFEKYHPGEPSKSTPEMCTLQTFQELRANVTEAIEKGYCVKIQVHFVEDFDLSKGKVKVKKKKFKFGLSSLNKLVSKVKDAGGISV